MMTLRLELVLFHLRTELQPPCLAQCLWCVAITPPPWLLPPWTLTFYKHLYSQSQVLPFNTWLLSSPARADPASPSFRDQLSRESLRSQKPRSGEAQRGPPQATLHTQA